MAAKKSGCNPCLQAVYTKKQNKKILTGIYRKTDLGNQSIHS